MDLSIQQLRMLREVARQGTIAKAAGQLGYTPSAVSQQLSAAEKSTGVAVLERVGRNVVLTDAGNELVFHADIVLEQLEQAQAAIERVQGKVAGELHVGFVESVGSSMLEPIMRRLRDDYPDLLLRTAAVDGFSPEELILRGELNISFVIGYPDVSPGAEDGCERRLVCRDWFRLVVPDAMFDGAPPASIDLALMRDEEFIAPPPTDACGLAALTALKKSGVDPFIAHRIADFPTTLRMVAAGAGVALVPDLGLTRVPEGVAVIELARPRHRTVDLTYRSSSAERPAMVAFMETVDAVAAEMELDRSHS